MLPPRVLELVLDSSEYLDLGDGDAPASAPTMFVAADAHLRAELVAPTALPAPPRMPSDTVAVHVPPPPRMPPMLSLVEPVATRPSSRPTVRVGSNRSQKLARVRRPSRPPPPSMPPPPGSAPVRKAA